MGEVHASFKMLDVGDRTDDAASMMAREDFGFPSVIGRFFA